MIYLQNDSLVSGTDVCPMKSVVRRIGQQLFAALSEKGIAVLVNHGIADEKVMYPTLSIIIFHSLTDKQASEHRCILIELDEKLPWATAFGTSKL